MKRIPVVLQLVILTVGLTALYTMVGQSVPQKEVRPPEVIELDKEMPVAEMVEIGKAIFDGKGICNTCHTIGKSGALRFPDLDDMAIRAATRRPGMSALDYLAESLYEPDIFIVDGFSPGMPIINKPPIGLTDDEILTVIAYLQTLGGEATVTMETRTVYTGGAAAEASPAEAEAGSSDSLLASRGCTECHHLDQPGTLNDGPSLYDVGSRLSRSQILDGVALHGPTPAENPYPDLTISEIRAMVDYLEALEGSS